MKTKRCKTKYTVDDAVRDFTVEDLRLFCLRNHINVKKSSRKETLALEAARFILENVGKILSRLMIWDLEIVRDLVQIGPGKALGVGHSVLSYAQTALLLRCSYDEKKDCAWYVMSDDLRETIGSTAEELLADASYRKKSEMLQFLQGLKYLYGDVYTWDARADFDRCYPEYHGNNEVWQELMSSPNTLEDMYSYKGDPEKGILVCPMLDYVSPEIIDILPAHEQQKRTRKTFTRQEILDAGTMPFPVFTCESAQRLKEYLAREWSISDALAADNLMFDLWLFSQPIYKQPDKATQLVKDYMSEDPKMIEELTVKVNEYINATPCWALAGNSVNET
jgi:hypothetical protein